MPAPILGLTETNAPNGLPGQDTDGITQIQFASVDSPSSTSGLAQSSPVIIGQNSFEKYFKVKVAATAPTSISNLLMYFNAIFITDAVGVQQNVMVQYATGPGDSVVFAQPQAGQSAVAIHQYSLNMGAPGLPLGDPPNSIGGTSQYFVLQMQLATTCAPGAIVIPSPFLSMQYLWS